MLTLYLGEGDEMAPANVAGVTGTLFMIAALCGYGAAAVVPSLVLDRPLFCAPLPALAPRPPNDTL